MSIPEVGRWYEISRDPLHMRFGAMERQLINLLFSASKIIISDLNKFVRYVRIRHYAHLPLARYMNCEFKTWPAADVLPIAVRLPRSRS